MTDFRRTHYTILTLTLACLLTAVPASAAPVLYGSTSGFGPVSTLYLISPTTGAATAIGPTAGFKLIGSLAFAPGGTIYGVGVDAGNSEVLLQINTATGAATAVGPLGPVGHFTVSDIAFRFDGRLFALIALSPFVDLNLYTINTATGAATLVGSLGVGLPSGNALAFLGNTLYYASSTVSGGRLFTLNQGAGAATLVTAMT
jgi:hypothetical protein